MQKRSAYDIVKSRHITEKSTVLGQLRFSTKNPSVKKCESPKYVFIVDKRANKQEIAAAVEEIYADRKVRVSAVNTIVVKPKACKRRGRVGVLQGFKKAIVTLTPGDSLEEA